MWSSKWGNIYRRGGSAHDRVRRRSGLRYLDKLLVSRSYTPEKMVRTGEAFYSSLGLEPCPPTFYERSLITRPGDREVVCHASAGTWTTETTSASRCAPR
jgi:peptidyl-dipeptidase A